MLKMTRRHALRLLKLARKLDSVPRCNFDMGHWFVKNDCGTTACILGWAGRIPEFYKAGLRASPTEWHGVVNLTPTTPLDQEAHEQSNYFGWANLTGSIAGQVFFGLSYEEAEELFFGPEGTPKQAAKRVRDVVSRHFPELVKSDRRKRLAAKK